MQAITEEADHSLALPALQYPERLPDAANTARNAQSERSLPEIEPEQPPTWLRNSVALAGVCSAVALLGSYTIRSAYLAPFGLQPEELGLLQCSVTRLIPAALVGSIFAIGLAVLAGHIAVYSGQRGRAHELLRSSASSPSSAPQRCQGRPLRAWSLCFSPGSACSPPRRTCPAAPGAAGSSAPCWLHQC